MPMDTLHPYLQSSLGGLLIGLASWWLLAALGRVTGISGIAAALLPGRQAPTRGDRAWRVAYLAGLVLGGALFTLWWQPPATVLRPLPLLVLAGGLVGFGTVLGSGCTSGHGVCGLGRRSLRSLVATATFMGTGFATVGLMRWLA
ncbi:YeeE/YedE family protein [Curvibacter cyanobacteriorum]|uniref:YeeE/YedE family protein n=1 Tax=Curvibacter cyanobacteriorum TaxID=3026422 RepID=UPI0039084048